LVNSVTRKDEVGRIFLFKLLLEKYFRYVGKLFVNLLTIGLRKVFSKNIVNKRAVISEN